MSGRVVVVSSALLHMRFYPRRRDLYGVVLACLFGLLMSGMWAGVGVPLSVNGGLSVVLGIPLW
jgi:hypothetical protein